jgi:hypothetical protein
MNQKVPVLFVLILAIAFATLLFFYFKATMDRYSIRVQNSIQQEVLYYYRVAQGETPLPMDQWNEFKLKMNSYESIQKDIQIIDSIFISKSLDLSEPQ